MSTVRSSSASKRDASLRPSERRSGAEVRTESEREVPLRLGPVRVVHVSGVVDVLITLAEPSMNNTDALRRNLRAGNLHVAAL